MQRMGEGRQNPVAFVGQNGFPTDLFQPPAFRPGEMMLSAPATNAHTLLIEQHPADA
jgi:hypothetical protein